MIYALVTNKKVNEKTQAEPVFMGSSEMVIDEYIYHPSVDTKILKKLKAQDTLVVENVASLGSDVSEVVKVLNDIADYKINLYLANENLSFRANKLSEIASSMLIALRLYQSLIALRSRNALQEKKAQGVKLGRPFGYNPDLKLDDKKEEIKRLLLAGVSKDKIAEKYNVCRSTVYNFVKKNPQLLSEEVL